MDACSAKMRLCKPPCPLACSRASGCHVCSKDKGPIVEFYKVASIFDDKPLCPAPNASRVQNHSILVLLLSSQANSMTSAYARGQAQTRPSNPLHFHPKLSS